MFIIINESIYFGIIMQPQKGLILSTRLPAQWEKQDYIMLVFPSTKSDWSHSIDEIQESYTELIKQISKYQKCVILYENKSDIDKIIDFSKNLKFIQMATNDTWIRDFGGICVFENGMIKILNFKFNAWGGKFDYTIDNSINTRLKTEGFFKKPMVDIDFILEGGSIDTNGKGILLTTENCIFNKNRNSNLTQKQIISKLKTTLGIDDIITLKYGSLEGDDTDSHVDTLARFISKDTIAYMKCYDKNDIHFTKLQKMEVELKKTGYNLLPLPLPGPKYFKNHRLPATYINFIFINSALIVPTYKDKNDKIVLEKLQDFFRDRKVIGVDASIFIREHGSLHCATINFMKE